MGRRNLLAVGNDAKTTKGEKYNVLTGIMYLAPHRLSGQNLCSMADLAGCGAACLNTAGRGLFNNVQAARLAKTRYYLDDTESFLVDLHANIGSLVRKAERIGATPMVRLNGTSDIMWERKHPEIFERWSDVQFYDYTKIPTRRDLPKNYHLTWSYSGVPGYAKYLPVALQNGMNVAVVFRSTPPESWAGLPVINGDDSDVRPYDPDGVIVGLTAKGPAKRDTTGFVVD